MQINKYWGMMMNLGGNMWEDVSDTLRLDKPMWDEYMLYLRDKGVNMVLVDIGEGLKYQCYPELAAKDAWSHEKFLAEMEAIRRKIKQKLDNVLRIGVILTLAEHKTIARSQGKAKRVIDKRKF